MNKSQSASTAKVALIEQEAALRALTWIKPVDFARRTPRSN